MTTPVRIYNTNLTANIDEEHIDNVNKLYPDAQVSVCFDSECELSKLKKGESACYGDGVNFYFILKEDEL